MSQFVKEISDATFADSVKSGLVLVDFWAPWCGPCMRMGPVLDEVATEMNGELQVCKMNVDENGETAVEHGISSIPAMLVFKDGVKVGEIVGYHSHDDLKQELQKMV